MNAVLSLRSVQNHVVVELRNSAHDCVVDPDCSKAKSLILPDNLTTSYTGKGGVERQSVQKHKKDDQFYFDFITYKYGHFGLPAKILGGGMPFAQIATFSAARVASARANLIITPFSGWVGLRASLKSSCEQVEHGISISILCKMRKCVASGGLISTVKKIYHTPEISVKNALRKSNFNVI